MGGRLVMPGVAQWVEGKKSSIGCVIEVPWLGSSCCDRADLANPLFNTLAIKIIGPTISSKWYPCM
jgi:hypothetical protein